MIKYFKNKIKKIIDKHIYEHLNSTYNNDIENKIRRIAEDYIHSILNKINADKNIIDTLGRPNGNSDKITHHIYLSYNIKRMMAKKAQERIKLLQLTTFPSQPQPHALTCKLSTQSDLESDWSRYWTGQIGLSFAYQRKLWEYSFILQCLYEHGMFGKKGLGFACGTEFLPSYLCSRGCQITAGDKPFDANDSLQTGWADTQQYTRSKEALFYPNLVDADDFENNFRLEYVDMNDIPDRLNDSFDFCWSICAIEHLGSIANGTDFLVNSLKVLKPGGLSIHTTEFNLYSNSYTIDNCGSVLFTRRNIEEISRRIEDSGAKMYPLDFDHGDELFDNYIDMPPFPSDTVPGINSKLPPVTSWPHLKLLYAGFPTTCFGIIIKKNEV